MVTEIDEGKGLVKTCWQKVRSRVAKVEPEFAAIVDELDPDKSFTLYLANLPYGTLKGDTQSTFLPKVDGGLYRLTDPCAPKDVIEDLGYGIGGAPLAMLLEKNLELFIDLEADRITIPRAVYTPGTFFPFARILSRKSSRTYAPNNVLTLTSGVRSTFVLPNIGCAVHHSNLQRDFNVRSAPPKTLYEHWNIFKEVVSSEMVKSDWHSCIMYFSEKWLDMIENSKKWLPLKLYLHKLGWSYSEYQRNHFYYEMAFSIIQKQRNLKPNPYLVDTAKHLFATAVGAAPGYAPAINEDALPLSLLQKAYVESYGLKKYIPTILQPTSFEFEVDEMPIYYSLQHPSTHVFSPKSRTVSSTLVEMRELQHIMEVFVAQLMKNDTMCVDTVMGEVARKIRFRYFHNKLDKHKIISPSSEIVAFDKRFAASSIRYKVKDACFAEDSPFVRGCISICAN